MAALAARVGASSGLAEATDIFNRAQIKSLAEIVKSQRGESDIIGIVGLTKRPGRSSAIGEPLCGLVLAIPSLGWSLIAGARWATSKASMAFTTSNWDSAARRRNSPACLPAPTNCARLLGFIFPPSSRRSLEILLLLSTYSAIFPRRYTR